MDPVTGVPLQDLMVSVMRVGVDESSESVDSGYSDPDEVPDADPVGRPEAFIAGFHKIDFNDDDAIDDMVAGIVEEYKAAAEARGLKFAPKGSLKVVSEGGVRVEDTT